MAKTKAKDPAKLYLRPDDGETINEDHLVDFLDEEVDEYVFVRRVLITAPIVLEDA